MMCDLRFTICDSSRPVRRVRRTVIGALVVLLFLSPPAAAGSEEEPGAANHTSEVINHTSLQIHLPREVTVEGSFLTLGQISVVRGDPDVVATALRTGLGQLSTPGQTALLDRPTILSRLATQGIPARQVRLTGAEAVRVSRFQRAITTEEFLEMGQAFLRQHPPAPSLHETIPTVHPKDLILPVSVRDLQVTPRLVKSGARGHVTVLITVTADGNPCGVREIPFRLKYQCRRTVAAEEIPAGTALTPENVKIETMLSDQPEPANWKPPYGLVAVRTLAAGAEIRPEMVGSAQPPAAVKRNETVVIRLQRPGLLVTAAGVALQEARPGELVKVRNADSSRVILCKVNADGTVEPMF